MLLLANTLQNSQHSIIVLRNVIDPRFTELNALFNDAAKVLIANNIRIGVRLRAFGKTALTSKLSYILSILKPYLQRRAGACLPFRDIEALIDSR